LLPIQSYPIALSSMDICLILEVCIGVF